ncbi:MAG: YbhB/YbcL family Raf kinase inhibitor-like protein [Bacteroidota bacterium]
MQKVLFSLFVLLSTSFVSFSQEGFTLSSKTLGGNATALEEFNNFGCTGENSSPELNWVNPPEGTKSFAITMYDPDAPTGSGWWHWVVFDIPADVHSIAPNAGDITNDLMPEKAIQTINNYGGKGYGGPCPPEDHGIHQYLITVHALDTDTLGLDDNTDPAVVGYNLWVHTIEKASLVTYYRRDKK